jgi:FKBP-type peptidyl-prolyl cis-trans isomerase FklB
MKKNIKYWALLPLVALLGACVSDEENGDVLFQQELDRIETYIQNFPTEYERRETVGETGIVLLFTEALEDGELAQFRDTLLVNYTGKLLDNTVFDTSVEQVAKDNNIFNENRNYEPFEVVLGVSNVISGWHGALSTMKEGEKATALIPSTYGYGNRGQGPIPANSVLVFELDLTENRPYQP